MSSQEFNIELEKIDDDIGYFQYCIERRGISDRIQKQLEMMIEVRKKFIRTYNLTKLIPNEKS